MRWMPGHRRTSALLAVFAAGALGGCTSLLGISQGELVGGDDAGPADATTEQSPAEGGADASDGTTHLPETGADARLEAGTDADSGSCAAGSSCSPAPCQNGVVTCTTSGQAMCIPLGTTANGTACDAGAVCDNGACAGCGAGADCSEAGSCQAMAISCASGVGTCTAAGNAPNGTGCGPNLYCNAGACQACANGSPCVPMSAACNVGSIQCADGGIACNDTGTKAADGTSCGQNMVCSGGACVSCTAGAACAPGGNPCATGTTSCSTGASTCAATGNLADGTPCGTNEVCSGGTCVACSTGAACNPGGNP